MDWGAKARDTLCDNETFCDFLYFPMFSDKNKAFLVLTEAQKMHCASRAN